MLDRRRRKSITSELLSGGWDRSLADIGVMVSRGAPSKDFLRTGCVSGTTAGKRFLPGCRGNRFPAQYDTREFWQACGHVVAAFPMRASGPILAFAPHLGSQA